MSWNGFHYWLNCGNDYWYKFSEYICAVDTVHAVHRVSVLTKIKQTCNANKTSATFYKKKYYMPTFWFAAPACPASLLRNWLHPELIISADGHKSETYAEWSVCATAGHLLPISQRRLLIHLISSPLASFPLSTSYFYCLPPDFRVFIWKEIGAHVR